MFKNQVKNMLASRKRRGYIPALTVMLSFSLAPQYASAQQRLTENVVKDPADAIFVYDDIEHFIEAHSAIVAGEDPAKALQSLYLDRATPGLKMYIEKYDLTVERLKKAMNEYSKKYANLDKVLAALKAEETAHRKTYAKLKQVISDAVFPPTYFLVAGHRGIGSGSTEGPLVSVEKKTPESIKSDPHSTLAHEMMHMQQLAVVKEKYFAIFSGKERTLLATSIREGAATFFAEVIVGESIHKKQARKFLMANEKELWLKFQEEMLGGKMGDWLWKKPANPDQPQDIGYVLGARIVEVYYNNAPDKAKAAREIMAITDYPAFLEKSGYAELMKR